MKPYFTKYLPAKSGEITDAFLRPDGKLVIMNEEQKKHWTDPNMVTYVKPFLCSRDIKAGDYVYEPRLEFEGLIRVVASNSSLQPTDYSKKPESWIMLDHAKSRGAYKVIGEISLDALSYTKEGDEIDKNQVEAWYYDDLHKSFLLKVGRLSVLQVDEEKWRELRGVRTIFKIKGPCGHFH